MASPVGRDMEESRQQPWSGTKVRGGATGGLPSPSPAKARQAQRRYRSLFHQAAKEYWAWREGEDDSQRALGSVFHLLHRLRLLEPGGDSGENVNLGGLDNLPGCRELLIRKHTTELERVMRLWRALVQQMKSQVSRVEESLAEAWQLHRSDPARTRLRPLHHPPPQSPSPLPPPPRLPPTPTATAPPRPPESSSTPRSFAVGLRSSLAGQASASKLDHRAGRLGAEGVDGDDSLGLPHHHALEGGTMESASASPLPRMGPEAALGGGLATTTVGPAEYLQWLGDMSSMLVHEQWRKEELLSRVAFGPEAAAARVRAHVQAHWSSRSADSFLDREVIDAAIASAQVVPSARAR